MAFSDVVALVVTYLTPIVNPVLVASRVPDPRPAELIQVRRVGGAALRPVREVVRLDVFAWAETEDRTFQLGTDVRTAMHALAGNTLLGPVVYDVGEFMSPRDDDDPETGTPRSWTTYELVVRADEVIQPAP